jgi:hypothetical protein
MTVRIRFGLKLLFTTNKRGEQHRTGARSRAKFKFSCVTLEPNELPRREKVSLSIRKVSFPGFSRFSQRNVIFCVTRPGLVVRSRTVVIVSRNKLGRQVRAFVSIVKEFSFDSEGFSLRPLD